jgi:phosphopantothenate---cysteine ligase (CTP)
MKIIVTCGPASEPIDDVRRITNQSTGELGVLLANALSESGHEVICCRSNSCTTPIPLQGAVEYGFNTNTELQRLLQALAAESADIVFHAAALSDYAVSRVEDHEGNLFSHWKIPSSCPEIVLRLQPVPKVIASLRHLFPQAKLVGWKYELEGDLAEVVERGKTQIENNQTDACIINGRAYGNGFGFLDRAGGCVDLGDKSALVFFLLTWIEGAIATR